MNSGKFFGSVEWGHDNSLLKSRVKVIFYKKPYNLETLILTAVCIVNI